jgi:hypothetical protein
VALDDYVHVERRASPTESLGLSQLETCQTLGCSVGVPSEEPNKKCVGQHLPLFPPAPDVD